MQVLRLHFLFAQAFDTVENTELGHVEEALHPIKLHSLQRIDAKVDLCEQWEVFDVTELVYLPNIIQTHIQKLQTFNLFQASQSRNIVLGQINGSQCGQHVKPLDCGQLIGAQIELFYPEAGQVLDFFDLVAVQGEDS